KDGSLKILEQYSDKIKIISKSNGGTASALNTGIRNMNGHWFKWLSADDLLYPTAIEDLVNVAEKLKNKENTIFYSNYDIIDSNGNIIEQFIEPDYNNLDQFEFNIILLDHYIGNGTTSLIHKSALDRYGLFDETIGFQEDYELWMRYCIQYNCRLYVISKILAKYRFHQNQLTSKKIGESLKNA
ncbi:MAG: glycosyltransferase, partial [Thaumarchaeota archaeon]|nr:glycosyltransferase [Nitrososphaerota archaeon]